MSSPLEGGLQQMFGAAFGGILLDGRHYSRVETRDDGGNVTSAVRKVQSVKGYRQSMTQAMRDAGYADTSAQLVIMQTYDGRVLDPIARGDKITLDGKWVIGNISPDPAHATWTCWVTIDG